MGMFGNNSKKLLIKTIYYLNDTMSIVKNRKQKYLITIRSLDLMLLKY